MREKERWIVGGDRVIFALRDDNNYIKEVNKWL